MLSIKMASSIASESGSTKNISIKRALSLSFGLLILDKVFIK